MIFQKGVFQNGNFQNTICRTARAELATLLLEPESAPAELRAHAGACPACREELAQLQSTMHLLDDWQAPEPTPFFEGRLAVCLREERQATPAGFIERLRARLLFGSNMQLRPLAAGALALLLVIGGGTYAGLVDSHPSGPAQTSATVRDLQSLDENAQVFQQLNKLDQDENDTGNTSSASANDL